MQTFCKRTAMCATAITILMTEPATAKDDFTCFAVKPALTTDGGDIWTEERRANAIPRDLNKTTNSGAEQDLELGAPEPVDVEETPYKYAGKLYFNLNGTDYSGSAQFVAEDNILLTAAHNVWEGENHATDITFYRAYSNGVGTKFNIDQGAILTAWKAVSEQGPSLPQAALDYAALRTTANSDVGKFEISRDDTFTEVQMIGYPSNYSAAAYMYKQDSQKLAKIGNAYQAAPTWLGKGASGGAWIPSDDLSTPIVSVVSAQILNGKVLNMTGPAFTDLTEDMIAFVKRGCE